MPSSSNPPPSEAPPPSEPPRSSLIPGRSGNNAPYVLGIVVLALLTGGLLFWKKSGTEEAKPAPAPPPVTATQVAVAPAPEFAPPPPPKEEVDAGVAQKATPRPGTVRTPTPCDQCGQGQATSALKSAVAARAGMARGCYNRALRTGGAEGSLLVSVSIGSSGNVCGASIVNDSVGSPSIAQCVVNKFRTAAYPKPKKGCVVINVPISFKLK